MNAFKVSVLLACVAFVRSMNGQEIIRPGELPHGAPPERPAFIPKSYIVVFATGTPKADRALVALTAGAQVRHNYDSVDALAIAVSTDAAVDALKRHRSVVQVFPDSVVRGRVKPGSGGGGTPITFSSEQLISYEVQRVGIPATGSDGSGIGIAVVDSGIDFNHPDLAPAPNSSATAFNAVTPGASCQDDAGHGTHIAGLIAAQNNTIGIVGVAPAAKLYCVKVLDSTISGSDSKVIAGLDWVLQNYKKVSPTIQVVNLSIGRPLATGETLDNSPLRSIIKALYNAGITVIAAAGNSPDVEITSMVPAGFPEVLPVASTVATNGIRTCLLFGLDLKSVPADTASGFSTDGAGVTVSAPGEERSDIVTLGSAGCVGLEYGTISTTLNTGGTTRKLVPGLQEARGTSFSAALVSGVVGRVLQKQLVNLTGNSAQVESVRRWLHDNADRSGVATLDHPWGSVIYNYTFDGIREGVAQAPK